MNGWACVCTDGPCREFPCKSYAATELEAGPLRDAVIAMLLEHDQTMRRLDPLSTVGQQYLREQILVRKELLGGLGIETVRPKPINDGGVEANLTPKPDIYLGAQGEMSEAFVRRLEGDPYHFVKDEGGEG